MIQMRTTILLLTVYSCISCSESQTKTTAPALIDTAQSADTSKLETPSAKKHRPTEQTAKAFFEHYAKEHPERFVTLETRLGKIRLKLYDETPLHRANFIYNIKEGLYDQTIFYRVVPEFMIQGGSSDDGETMEKRESAGAYYVPNESKPWLMHKRGSIAMAMSYQDNPDLKSAQYSFYIVIGKVLNDGGLDAVEEEYNIKLTAEAREIYKTIGGAPHLDSKHTVFGEVIQGMEVVEAIAAEKRDSGDWPVNDVVISYVITY